MTMTTLEIIEEFVAGADRGKASGGRLLIEGNKLYNYNTVIGQRTSEGYVVNITQYSPTTSKHRNRLLRELQDTGTSYKTVDDLDEGTQSLA